MSLRDLLGGGEVILLDGAMGTQLAAAGFDQGGEQCLLHPDAVERIHRSYIDAGCRGIITNTLTMNRIFLSSHGRAVDVAEVNRRGVELARSAAAGQDIFILGDISSTGQLLEPYGDCTEAQFEECFREQASILGDAGVDGLIVETVIDLREAVCAVRAARKTGLPVLATLSFQTLKDGGRTVMGSGVQDIVRALEAEGASGIGANCGALDPQETARIISGMRASTTLPLIAQPNAGKPRLENGTAVFDLGPEEFARGIAACIVAGAGIVGGCCGTSPAHIARAAEMLAAPA